MIDIEYYKKFMYDAIGAIHEVHCELGAGLNESCYQEGLEIQLKEQKIEYLRELSFHHSTTIKKWMLCSVSTSYARGK